MMDIIYSRRHVLSAIFLVVLTVFVTACGQNKEVGPEPALQVGAEVTPTPTPSATPTPTVEPDPNLSITELSSNVGALTAFTSATMRFSGASETGVAFGFECKLDGGAFSGCTSPVTVTSLAAGSHSFSVRAKDNSGHSSSTQTFSWTIDSSVPSVSIDSSPAAYLNATSATFAFSGASGAASFECKLDTAAFAACSSSTTYSNLSEGLHSFDVKPINSLGTRGSAVSRSFRVDLTAPVVTLSSSAANPTASTSATMTFSATDTNGSGVQGYECKLDTADFTVCTSQVALSALTSAAHTFSVRARDNAGNISSAAGFGWQVDTSVPTVNIISAPAAFINTNSATFTFSGTTGATALSYECKLDSIAFWFMACTSPVTYQNLLEGVHNFEVRATNAVGTPSATVTRSFRVDRTAPIVTLASSVVSPTASTSATMTFSATDTDGSGVQGFECKLDSANFAACTNPVALTSLISGPHTFSVRAKDNMGNTSVPQTFSWRVDTSVPVVTITSAPAAFINATTATFIFSGSSGATSFECNFDSIAFFMSCASPATYSSLSEGSHNLQVRPINGVGTLGTIVTRSFLVDRTAPIATLSSSVEAMTASSSATMTLTATDSGGSGLQGFECTLDGANFAACTSPVALSGLAGGSHTFVARARDNAGNTSLAQSFSWTVDTSVPTVSITSSPAAYINGRTADFNFTSSSGAPNFECSFDSAGVFTSCASTKTYSSLSEGAHSFQVKAINAAGTRSAAASRNFVVDLTAPIATLSSSVGATTASTSATMTFSATDSGGSGVQGFECKLDTADFAACTNPVALSSLSLGEHAFTVRARDNAGNLSTTQNFSWSILSVPSITTQPVQVVSKTGQSASFQVVAAGSPTLTYQWRKAAQDISGATSSSYTIQATSASDEALYQVRVSNSVGSVLSSSVNLIVHRPPTITTQPSSLTLNEGAQASFSVAATGRGTLSYQWLKDNQVMTNVAGKISGVNTASLNISNIVPSDQAWYTVLVTDTLSGVQQTLMSEYRNLVVISTAPTISAQPLSATGYAGDSVSFSVTATGPGTLTYQWFKGASALANSATTSGATTAQLTLTNLQASNAGSYSVRVTSTFNGTTQTTNSASATLTVNEPLQISQPSDFLNIYSHPSARFALMNDIDMTGIVVEPSASIFSGQFEGNSHTIRNLRIAGISQIWNSFFGVFPRVSGRVRNITFENITVVSNGLTGGVVGEVLSGGVVENVNVMAGLVAGGWAVGGIAGVNRGTLRNTFFAGQVQNLILQFTDGTRSHVLKTSTRYHVPKQVLVGGFFGKTNSATGVSFHTEDSFMNIIADRVMSEDQRYDHSDGSQHFSPRTARNFGSLYIVGPMYIYYVGFIFAGFPDNFTSYDSAGLYPNGAPALPLDWGSGPLNRELEGASQVPPSQLRYGMIAGYLESLIMGDIAEGSREYCFNKVNTTTASTYVEDLRLSNVPLSYKPYPEAPGLAGSDFADGSFLIGGVVGLNEGAAEQIRSYGLIYIRDID